MTRGATLVLALLTIGSWTANIHADPNAERALKTANGLLERGLAAEAIPEYRGALAGLDVPAPTTQFLDARQRR